MQKRFVSLWFPYLLTDHLSLRQPGLKDRACIFAVKVKGAQVITAANRMAEEQGACKGMSVADARALIPAMAVADEQPGKAGRLLYALGEWCIRYSPVVAVDLQDGLILDASGCAHLWGGEEGYLGEITGRLKTKGYHVRAALSDTIGASWAMARYGQVSPVVVAPGGQSDALLPLTPAALRLAPGILERLQKLGLRSIGKFAAMKRSVLRRRFGDQLLLRTGQALGTEEEYLQPLVPPVIYQERLPCLEPILTATGIGIAIARLLEALCSRLVKEGKGLRSAVLKCYRIDGKTVQAAIGTYKASYHVLHLYKLFELNIALLEPGPGIELFVLEAPKVEQVAAGNEALWTEEHRADDTALAELLDRLAGKMGENRISRYLPDEHYWPERSIRRAGSLEETASAPWRRDLPRPVRLLSRPERIEVSAPVPDYPPMLFRYKGKVHPVKKADGPERIASEWWIEESEHRDYFEVEDDSGARYWLFRLGHYCEGQAGNWFIHGFFA